ncbi:aspartate kinase [Peptoniphilus sp. KCTC 25270]|uniref:aspartate kinase n=1 Tax=Peptoniphilus sp. KCTC 25270 TaxID=2897414 RepID=UPI001E2DF96B|nr:aspartate kinase [Peptoniphilus sp. KCTC 25270]MCD1146877.1 aspartate kinase [Peptoniphilus sp. KCTC 25270]
MCIVAKFGGSSLANGQQFEKVKNIVTSCDDRKYIIPSAPGKVSKEDQKVTDLLYLLYNMASHNLNYKEILDMIRVRYDQIIESLHLDLNLDEEFQAIEASIQKGATKDYLSSRGEYLNGKVLSHYLGYDFIDAKDVIFFREDGTFDEEKSYAAIQKMAKEHEHAVIPGFYGAKPSGEIITFSRGGSDLTGSIIARGVSAKLYENWTDVSGFLASDPRIVENPRQIEYITYNELRELSYSGANILHDEAIFPVVSKGIPINIRNTNRPEDQGTFIVEEQSKDNTFHTLTGVTGRKNFTVINISKVRMNSELSFHRKIMTVLEANDIYLEHMPSSIDSLSLIIADKYLQNKTDALINEFKTFCNPDSITVDKDIALVTVVGRNMKNHVGISAKLFSALAQSNINIQMIIQGASEMNIIVGIKNSDYEKAINSIYHAFEDK